MVQYGEQRDTTKAVQAIFEKKARLMVVLLLRNVTYRSALEAHVRRQMGTGFGYFRLSDKVRPNLCFALDAKEVVAKGIKPTELSLVWQIGVVGGIRANGCPTMGT